ncbi:MAG: glycosyltransferase family 4 protein, partial [Proteobacteria bacterium]|nr:glycosyltransferase family 4 protein [Pseudomonadota bacterium]
MRICVLANALSVHTQRWARAYAERGHEVHVLSIRWAEIS